MRPAIVTRDGLGCRCREIERDPPGEVAGPEDQYVSANVGHDAPAAAMYVVAAAMVDSAMRTIHTDVAIIGGGLVGTWTAYFLRKRGHSVAVIEKGAVGSQASGVNFGNVRLEGRHPTEFPLALRAHELWERIEQLIGETCEFTPCGHSYIALDPKELARLERYQREGTAGGLEIELLGANDVRRRFPYLGPDVCGATWSKRDGTANPRLATPAVARAARALGADIFPNTRVVALERAGERFRVVTDRDSCSRRRSSSTPRARGATRSPSMFGETTPMFPAAPPNFVTEPLPYFINTALQDAGGAVIIRQVERGNVIVGFYPRGPADRVRNRAPVPPAKVCSDWSTWRAWCRCSPPRRSFGCGRGSKAICPTCSR